MWSLQVRRFRNSSTLASRNIKWCVPRLQPGAIMRKERARRGFSIMYEVNYQQRRRRLFCLAPADIMTKYPAANTNSLERAGPRNRCKVDNNDTNKLTLPFKKRLIQSSLQSRTRDIKTHERVELAVIKQIKSLKGDFFKQMGFQK